MIERNSGIRSILAATLAAASLGIPATLAAAGASDVYTIANYPVDARAKDAVTAKEQALTEGQQAALRSLLRRLVPVTSYARLKKMPQLQAANIVDGVSVRSERNSSTDYIATLDFSFQPAAVRDALVRNGIPFVDTQAPQTVVITLARAKPDAAFESGTGTWFEAWKGLDLVHTVSPLKLEGLKPAITPDAIAAMAGGTGSAGPVFASEYKTDRIVIALAEPDATGKKLNVTLAGTDGVGSFILKRTYRVSGGDTQYTAELAAVVGLGVLEGRWKAAKGGAMGGVEPAAGNGIQIVAEFTSLSEWNEIRTRILDTDGAFDVTIGSVSARSAEVSLRHPGGTQGLAEALAAHGLTLDQTGSGWRVHSTF